MANYQKMISYLDYLENGMKIRNAGFVRAEENNGQMRMEVRMKNLPDMFSGEYELHADCGGVIGTISLNRGSGSCCIVWNKADAERENGVDAGGVYLRFPGRRLVQTVWPAPMTVPVRRAEEDDGQTENVDEKVAAQQPVQQVKEPDDVAAPERVPVPEAEQRFAPCECARQLLEPNMTPQAESTMMSPLEPIAASSAESSAAPLPQELPVAPEQPEQYFSDKWEQLTHMYPLIHPFQDERAYLSIAPKDFVVLCRAYQKMVHNSFLLHGFYNYHHLLLGRIQEKDEWHYYLGVPGNFYTREKMVAEMFGFEAFEGEKNPASSGDFGYYMKRVEI